MRSTGNGSRPPAKEVCRIEPADGNSLIPTEMEDLRVRVQQISLREQIERNHFLLMRLNAANARLIQSLEQGDVFDAIAEIIANLIGSEEVAVFDYHAAEQNFSLAGRRALKQKPCSPFCVAPACSAALCSRA